MKNLLAILPILFSLNMYAQGEEIETKHSFLAYPSRILNFYFPTVSIGYQYYPSSNWSGGITIGAVSDDDIINKSQLNELIGFDIGIEGRYRLGGIENRPWGVFLGLEASRAYATRPFGLESTDIEGVSKVVETKVVARREELNAGLAKNWRFTSGFTLDLRLGIGVNAWSWTANDKNVAIAPVIYSFYDEDGHYGLPKNQANQHELYIAPRIRMGLGYSF